MKIMFMGTPEISAGALSVLIERGHDVACVVTGEDKPRGRGNVMTPTPTKRLALEKACFRKGNSRIYSQNAQGRGICRASQRNKSRAYLRCGIRKDTSRKRDKIS